MNDLEKALENIYKIYPFISISIEDNSEVHQVNVLVEFYFRGGHFPLRNSINFTLDDINNDDQLIGYLVRKTIEQIRYYIDLKVS